MSLLAKLPVVVSPGLHFPLGRIFRRKEVEVVLDDAYVRSHMAIYGGTGKGKSKFLELLIRSLISHRGAGCVIDPHGDLVEDLLAWVAERKNGIDPLYLKRILYFEPGHPTQRFSYDPFCYRPPADAGPTHYTEWREYRVNVMAAIILRHQGRIDTQGRPRLERWLKNSLTAIAALLPDGSHLPLPLIFALLDPDDPRHDRLYESVRSELPPEIVSDFKKLRDPKARPRDRDEMVSSTINQLRSFFSSAVAQLFLQKTESINFTEAVDTGALLLVNLADSGHSTFGEPHANALGGLFIQEILDAIKRRASRPRPHFYLFVDEAANFIAADVMKALAQYRKRGLSVVLGFQQLKQLQNEFVDMLPDVLNLCDIHVGFQTRDPSDLELLAQVFQTPNLDFTPLVHEVDRFDGYEILVTQDTAEGKTQSAGKAHVEGRSKSDISSRSNSTGQTTTDFGSMTAHFDPATGTLIQVPIAGAGNADNQGSAESEGHVEGANSADVVSQHAGTSETTMTRQNLMTKHRTEKVHQGRLQTSTDDQYAGMRQQLRTLPVARCLLSVNHEKTVAIQVKHVAAAFGQDTPELRRKIIESMKGILTAPHPYYFTPEKIDTDALIDSLLPTTPPPAPDDAPTQQRQPLHRATSPVAPKPTPSDPSSPFADGF